MQSVKYTDVGSETHSNSSFTIGQGGEGRGGKGGFHPALGEVPGSWSRIKALKLKGQGKIPYQDHF